MTTITVVFIFAMHLLTIFLEITSLKNAQAAAHSSLMQTIIPELEYALEDAQEPTLLKE
jgi:hypothetical protein